LPMFRDNTWIQSSDDQEILDFLTLEYGYVVLKSR
jgi:hypothetical protein